MIIKPQFKLKNTKMVFIWVSTPLGNLKDITFRAIEVLENLIIFCVRTLGFQKSF